MIFRPESVERILTGSKTVTRRVAKGPCRYAVGKDYAVQPGRSESAVARIFITSVRLEMLGKVEAAGELAREGFGPGNEPSLLTARRKFVKVWEQLHGHYDPGEKVYRIEFEVVSNGS